MHFSHATKSIPVINVDLQKTQTFFLKLNRSIVLVNRRFNILPGSGMSAPGVEVIADAAWTEALGRRCKIPGRPLELTDTPAIDVAFGVGVRADAVLSLTLAYDRRCKMPAEALELTALDAPDVAVDVCVRADAVLALAVAFDRRCTMPERALATDGVVDVCAAACTFPLNTKVMRSRRLTFSRQIGQFGLLQKRIIIKIRVGLFIL